ncbi:MAG: hypothetical protein ABI318_10680, partial [Chthoniobacteraceae bacterium]
IEHSTVPPVSGHKGELRAPEFSTVSAEVARIETGLQFRRPAFVHGWNGATVGPFSENGVTEFAHALGLREITPLPAELPVEQRKDFDASVRHQRFFTEMEEHVRDEGFLYKVMPEFTDNKWSTEKQHPTHPAKKFIAGAKTHRERFWEKGMGRFDEPLLPFNARMRKVAEIAKWTAYDVVLDVFPKLFAWGLLVVPKDLKPGERRPVVVCQHGRNGIPRDLLDGNKTAYNNVAAALAEREFITCAPHNLYRGEDHYRWLDRKANTVKTTLFSFIIAQHDQILRWLETQPFVDPQRIAFYGLSYGGETVVRVPPILKKYCFSICSGDFNQWTRKVASTDESFSIHALDRMGDALLESRPHLRLRRDDLPDGAAALHGRARPSRPCGPGPMGRARVCQGALALRATRPRRSHGDRVFPGWPQHARRWLVRFSPQASELAEPMTTRVIFNRVHTALLEWIEMSR